MPYSDYLYELTVSGEIDEETRQSAVSLGRTADKDSDLVKEYIEKFEKKYKGVYCRYFNCRIVAYARRFTAKIISFHCFVNIPFAILYTSSHKK